MRLRDGDPDVLAEYDKHGRLRDGGTTEQAAAAASRAWLADTLSGREALLMVDTNRAAAQVSAALRDELVELGRVTPTGVALGRDGWQDIVAGVGDLVQARRNGWELIGYAGNAAAPLNAETFRVTALREDGGLTVAPVVQRSADGEELGAPVQLSPAYVAADLTLAYASTVHAAEGRTVDTTHSVTGGSANLASLLVQLTRGREANTAWVRETFDVHARTPQAVLAGVLENAQEEWSALAERERAEVEARSTMTHVDQLIAIAEQVSTGRTSAALDRLAAAGRITEHERAQFAADGTMWSLERLLRTAELAGHDPDTVLDAAVAARHLRDARSLAQVVHHRISKTLEGRLTPHVTSAADLIPRDVPEDHRAWFAHRAEAADERRRELGAQTAQEAPGWAVAALGPVPDDGPARGDWETRAGWAAAWRELSGHDSADELDPLGAAPARGLVEKAALFRAAHEALGLVDAGAEEAGMSDGQLRVRIRAAEREQACAPRYVADELAATAEAAQKARTDATLWTARAQAPDVDDADRDRLRGVAEDAARRADELDLQVVQLEYADEARTRFYLHSAVTSDKGERAAAELRARGVDPDDTSDRVTAREWLAAHRAAQADDDAHRDIDDVDELLEDAHRAGDRADAPVLDDRADLRDRTTPNPYEHTDPAQRRRVLPPDETAAAVSRAQDVLAEITAREQADAERAARDTEDAARAEELVRWDVQDQADEATAGLTDEVDDSEPALER